MSHINTDEIKRTLRGFAEIPFDILAPMIAVREAGPARNKATGRFMLAIVAGRYGNDSFSLNSRTVSCWSMLDFCLYAKQAPIEVNNTVAIDVPCAVCGCNLRAPLRSGRAINAPNYRQL